jgi:hypothetical protein
VYEHRALCSNKPARNSLTLSCARTPASSRARSYRRAASATSQDLKNHDTDGPPRTAIITAQEGNVERQTPIAAAQNFGATSFDVYSGRGLPRQDKFKALAPLVNDHPRMRNISR